MITKKPGDSVCLRLSDEDIAALKAIAGIWSDVSGVAESPGIGPMIHWALDLSRRTPAALRMYIAGRFSKFGYDEVKENG